jgi:hypothetical protein
LQEQEKFSISMSMLFDISTSETFELIKDKKITRFMKDQRTYRILTEDNRIRWPDSRKRVLIEYSSH